MNGSWKPDTRLSVKVKCRVQMYKAMSCHIHWQRRKECVPGDMSERFLTWNKRRLTKSLTRAGSCKFLNWIHNKWDKTCCYRNINYCDIDERGMFRQEKERNRISNRIGNGIRNNFYFLINQNVSKLQIILMSISFKAEKKGKKARKEKRRWFTAGKKNSRELWYSNLRHN